MSKLENRISELEQKQTADRVDPDLPIADLMKMFDVDIEQKYDDALDDFSEALRNADVGEYEAPDGFE